MGSAGVGSPGLLGAGCDESTAESGYRVWLQLLAGTVAEGDLWPGRKMTGGGEGEVRQVCVCVCVCVWSGWCVCVCVWSGRCVCVCVCGECALPGDMWPERKMTGSWGGGQAIVCVCGGECSPLPGP